MYYTKRNGEWLEQNYYKNFAKQFAGKSTREINKIIKRLQKIGGMEKEIKEIYQLNK